MNRDLGDFLNIAFNYFKNELYDKRREKNSNEK